MAKRASLATRRAERMLRPLTREIVRPGSEELAREAAQGKASAESLQAYDGGLIAFDDFTGSDGTNLDSHSGSPATWTRDSEFDQFTLFENKIRCTISGGVGHTLSQSPSSPSYAIEYDYIPLNANNIGCQFKREAGGNRYNLLHTTSGWEIQKIISGVPTTLDSGVFSFDVGVTYAIKMRVVRNTFTLFVDGAQLSQVTDDSVTGVFVGVRKTASAVAGYLDNFRVTSLALPMFVLGIDNPDDPDDFWVA